jgi:hypothetical protein
MNSIWNLVSSMVEGKSVEIVSKAPCFEILHGQVLSIEKESGGRNPLHLNLVVLLDDGTYRECYCQAR